MSEFKGFVVGDRVTKSKVSMRNKKKRRRKGTVMFTYLDDGKELYQVKWDNSFSDTFDWYHADDLVQVGRRQVVKAVKRTKGVNSRWWESAFPPRKTHTEAVDTLVKELSTPPEDVARHVL